MTATIGVRLEKNKNKLIFCKDYRLSNAIEIPEEWKDLGPQNMAIAYGTQKGHRFFATYHYETVKEKALHSYCSFVDHTSFLNHIASLAEEEMCFFELIRANLPCTEYYDLEWKLDPTKCIYRSEQQIFEELFDARKLVGEECSQDAFRILSASSQSIGKGSLHVIGPRLFRNNHTHMKAFITRLKESLKSQNPLHAVVDWGVYTSNRAFRCEGQHKRNDPLKRTLKPAEWHPVSMKAEKSEFLVTRFVNADIAEDVLDSKQSEPVYRVAKPSTFGYKSLKVLEPAKNHVLYPIYLSKFSNQYKFNVLSPTMARLARISPGICMICMRKHTSENALLYSSHGCVYFRCFRHIGPAIFIEDTHEVCTEPLRCDNKELPGVQTEQTPILVTSAPGLCRWSDHLYAMRTTPDHPYVIGALVHIYCVDNNKEKIVCRESDTGVLSIIMDAALADHTMNCIKGRRDLITTTVNDNVWYSARNFGPLSAMISGTRRIIPIDNSTVEATVLSLAENASRRAVCLKTRCVRDRVYTIYKFEKRKTRLYINVQDDTDCSVLAYITRDVGVIWRHFIAPNPTALRFVYRAPNRCEIVPWN